MKVCLCNILSLLIKLGLVTAYTGSGPNSGTIYYLFDKWSICIK